MGQDIIYHYSLNSPWSYLGDEQLTTIAARNRANIIHKPTNFALVFPKTGGIPVAKRAPSRQNYRLQELHRWRTHLGIPLIMEPTHWPCNERLAVGMILAGVRKNLEVGILANAFFCGLWAEDRDISDRKILITIAEENGFNGGDLLEEGREKQIEQQWEENAEAALITGVFGAPSYVLGKQIFWGQDRLEFLERALNVSK